MLKYFISFFCFIFIFISCSDSNFQKALNYQSDRDYDKAIIFYDKAISKNENVAQAQKNKGDIYFTKKDLRNAFDCYKKSIELDSNSSVEYIFKLLSDINKDVRDSAKDMITKVNNPQIKEKILANISKMLKSEKPFEKLDALDVVSAFGNDINPIINDVLELINDDNITVKQKVFEILPSISDIAIKAGAIDKLFALSENSNDMIAASAIECIGNMKNFASYLPKLIDTTKTKPALKQSILDTIEKVNTPSKQEATELLKYLSSKENTQIRLLVLSLFKKMHNEANTFIPTFIVLSNDKNSSVAKSAGDIISNINTSDPSIVDELIKLLSNNNKDIKIKAIRELANIGEPASNAIEPLKKLAKNSDKEIKSSAQIAIKQIQK